MKSILRVAFAVLTFVTIQSFGAFAQTYTVQSIPYTPYPYAGDGTEIPIVDDQYSDIIPIGFTFNFFGNNYSELLVATNGYLTFDLLDATGYSPWNIAGPIPDSIATYAPTNAIMGPWHDIYPGAFGAPFPGTVGYALYGAAPYRRFVVSYYEIPYFSCVDSSYTGQIILYETINAIDVFIEHKSVCATWNNGAAIEGIQNIDGTLGYTIPGRNYPDQWTAYNDGWRFSPCAPTSPTDTLSGHVFIDANGNCLFDAGEQPLLHELVIADDCVIAYTDTNGFYSMVLEPGTHTITHAVPGYAQYECPVGNEHTVTFAVPYESISNVDFADTLNPSACTDVNALVGTPFLKLCSQNLYTFQYCNNSTDATLPLMFDVTVADSTFIVGGSSPVVSSSGNTYTFNLPYLMPGACGWFHFIDSVSCDATVGTVKCLDVNVYGNIDCDSTNNAASDCQTVVASFDPNEMLVASQNFTQRGYIHGETIQSGDSLQFHINFQNTGTAPAYDVVVVDTLPSSVDASTVISGMSSHAYTFTNNNGILTWTFANIMLPDSGANELESHGFVRFSVKQNTGNVPGQLISNRASIYFDSNAPVLTNYATDTLENVNGLVEITNNNLLVYPNPTRNAVFIRYNGNETNTTLTVFNTLGQKIKTTELKSNGSTINTASWPKGIYMLRVTSGNATVATRPLVVN